MKVVATLIFSLACVVFLFQACTEQAPKVIEKQASITKSIFSDDVSSFKLNVFFETGATPYVGNIGLSGNDTWDVSLESYKALFSSHTNRSILIPNSLGDMTSIADQSTSNWSSDDLISLGNAISPELIDGTNVNMSIIFLNGVFDGNASILGVHFTGTHFAFVFKDVVESVGGDGVTQRYVEQATVVHEIGHAVGLVNSGIPMQVMHEDNTHPHHTVNEDGVMYWAVESKGSILSFLTDIIAGSRLNLFETESLNDAQSFHP